MKIFIKVRTNANKNEVIKIDNTNYNIYTTATPENGKANQSIIELLAKFLRVGKTKIKIISGLTSKNKTIEILEDN